MFRTRATHARARRVRARGRRLALFPAGTHIPLPAGAKLGPGWLHSGHFVCHSLFFWGLSTEFGGWAWITTPRGDFLLPRGFGQIEEAKKQLKVLLKTLQN
ncbi:hypothetical protein GPALN_011458 [Globodera pallida]|nr:hypothetical protein GPALN_011458 [Globodera pallida]